ncbi:septin-4-like isoform X2 [Hyla sarda]|uniref:septin-4-like isoform X2 n=1 Tax=Hyla sarda TaxID=327740 RepID=UPI0024C28CB9|nr:septin-4-like isoform X2 [Hyla sarda]
MSGRTGGKDGCLYLRTRCVGPGDHRRHPAEITAQIKNFLRNDSEEEELKEINHTIPRESNKKAQEQQDQFYTHREEENSCREEERLHISKAQVKGQHLRQHLEEEQLFRDPQEESLVKEHQEEEERLRREHQEEKLRREPCEGEEKLRREQQREEEERLHRQYQEETLRREQQEGEERQRKDRQQEIRLQATHRNQIEGNLPTEHSGEKFWWEQETEKHNIAQQKYYRDQHVEHLCNDAMQSHLEPELFSVRHIKENSDEGEDTSQTLPVLPPGWGCPPLVPPPSPSRPKSPWGKLDPYDSNEEDREYVGFATLPNQVHRKYVKKGFEFTLMVAGESGLGKSTLINSLFLTDLYRGRQLPSPEERVTQTIEIVKQTVDIQEKGVRLRLTVVDTPGYGDAINNEECWKPVADYIDQQFEQYFRDESGLNRKNLQDTRVHCCLYFLSPLGHGMRPLDIEFLRALQDRVNIVPILGKADSLTPKELIQKKQRIREELDHYGIRIYQFPDCDSDQDEEFKIQDMELKKSIPFAVIGSNTIVEVNGKRVRGRLYPWGVVEVENEQHCDFVKLRTMLVRTHMQDLKDVTRETHYENYRAQCIQSLTQRVVRERNRNKLTRESGTDFPIPSVPPSPDHETMKLIREKDEELRRMQEVLQNMQRQMKDSK